MKLPHLTLAFACTMLLAIQTAWAVDPNKVIDLRMDRVLISPIAKEAGKGLVGAKWVPKFTVQAGVKIWLECDFSVNLVDAKQWKTKVKRTIQYVVKVDDSIVRTGGHSLPPGLTLDAGGPISTYRHIVFGGWWTAFPSQHRITCTVLESGFEEPNVYNNTVEVLLDVTPAQIQLGAKPTTTQPPRGSTLPPIAGARAVQLAAAQSPDLTSAPQLKVAGKHTVAWNGSLALTDADARAKSDGVCQVAFAHVMRNVGTEASGPFSRRWSNQGKTADMNANAPSIPAGASLERTDTLALWPGVNQLSFGLDPTNQVKETNETNNSFGLIVTLNGTCGSALAKTQASSAGNLRFAPAQAANTRLPAVQQQPGPPTSQLKQQPQQR